MYMQVEINLALVTTSMVMYLTTMMMKRTMDPARIMNMIMSTMNEDYNTHPSTSHAANNNEDSFY